MSDLRCERCGIPCRPGKPDPKARLLQLSGGPHGFCVNCAVTAWLKATDVVREQVARNGASSLLHPHIQEQFSRIIRAGHGQVRPEQIDWPWIVEMWDLPCPGRRRHESA